MTYIPSQTKLASLLLHLVAKKIGSTIDGKIMAGFRVLSKNSSIIFLFDADNYHIIECGARGKHLPEQKWENTKPQQFVARRWNGTVTALSRIFVRDRSPITNVRYTTQDSRLKN
jgi:hypothetical protein